ncbi:MULTISPECIES: lactaldehyde reductase [Providencia]|uniref:Lactaldehyde reductase n=1 Tax=Providencia rettgeri TaxID=587 RepID=A0A2U9LBS9_PRORE|nr:MULTISPECIES: lactaldehyde reductase [Providencia]AWS52520.1 lactaldehyde reductase [Providencia rettgeri]EHZ7762315.1 lactaldehyde reductase [Providencia rettgeri]EIJ7165457.1 lactaldehyde reductase [Providencia rettgeri]EJD6046556.1 lactaldehyde reductase [Providencia rettgeri]EJD6049484.1 lactaldehyde reductase [Providencia rettgeri]
MTHRMILNETSYFGEGAINHLVEEIQKRQFNKALIVTDADLVKFNVVSKVTQLLDNAKLDYAIYDAVIPNPTIDTVQQGLKHFKQFNADYLIAIGGGSPQDTAKAIGIIINNPQYEDVVSLEGVAPTQNPAVPIIAIPTTAGTAAEVTINYVITDNKLCRKFVCVDPHSIPIVAIIDPLMMASMPASLKAATGVDALTHAIEGYITKGAWALTDALHLKSIELISNSLRQSVKGDPQGVETMALAQYMAGMGFSNVGLGLVHGMAHPLGAFYNTPHGVANAILLPHIMAYNANYTGEKYRDIARAMGVKNIDSLPLQEARDTAIAAVFALNKNVGIPEKLREIGMKPEDIPSLAQAAFDDVCTGGNPRDATLEDIAELYQAIY